MTRKVQKDIVVYPENVKSGFQVQCEVGCIDGKFVDIAFQIILQDGVTQPATFVKTVYGFEHTYTGADSDKLDTVFSGLKKEFTNKYGIEWEEKPPMQEQKNKEEEK